MARSHPRWRGALVALALAFGLAPACGGRTGLLAPLGPEDAGPDAGVDRAADAPPDVLVDVALDVPADVPLDVPADVPIDVPVDAPPLLQGCADGQREGFVDDKTFPDIAGCSGGWSVPGVMPFDPGTAPDCPSVKTFDTVTPACNRQGGDDGPNPAGAGCDVADLCEAGWHVCASPADITGHSPSGCTGVTRNGDPPLFFVSRESSNGCGVCASGSGSGSSCNGSSCVSGCAESAATSNDVFGCGNFGATIPFVDCGPIDRFSNNLCTGLGANWTCIDDGSGLCEAFVLTHGGPAFGGVLCCRD